MLDNKHPLITEFLIYGRDELAYSHHTLKGYRSALNAMVVVHPDIDILALTAANLIAYDQSRSRGRGPGTAAGRTRHDPAGGVQTLEPPADALRATYSPHRQKEGQMGKRMTLKGLGTGPVRECGKPAPVVKRKVGDREAEARRLREERAAASNA